MVDKLKNKYKIDSFYEPSDNEQSQKIWAGAEIYSKYFLKLKDRLDIRSIKLYTSTEYNMILAVIPFKEYPDKILALKGAWFKGTFVMDKELLSFGISSDNLNQQNSRVILNGDGAGVLLYSDGKNPIIEAVGKESVDSYFSFITDRFGHHGGDGFCQREEEESFSDGYKAEVDEFCDGFFSCLALTRPAVHVLIAASCSCGA